MKRNIVVLYHGDCADGFTAAWAAYKKFGSKAEYIPILHGTTPITHLKGKDVYFLDIVYERAILNRIIKENKSVTVLDHHITREKETKSAPKYMYSLRHSGAMLAWKYFFPKKKVPRLVTLVQEEDLWKFKTIGVREILACVRLQPFEFEAWTRIAKDLEFPEIKKQYRARGAIILRYKKQLIDEILQNANPVTFEGYKTFAVNAPSAFSSEIGNILATEMLPPIGIVWSERRGRISVSLRSNGKADVAKLAEKYGGGGHKAAAGFRLSIGEKLPWRKR